MFFILKKVTYYWTRNVEPFLLNTLYITVVVYIYIVATCFQKCTVPHYVRYKMTYNVRLELSYLFYKWNDLFCGGGKKRALLLKEQNFNYQFSKNSPSGGLSTKIKGTHTHKDNIFLPYYDGVIICQNKKKKEEKKKQLSDMENIMRFKSHKCCGISRISNVTNEMDHTITT